MEIYPEPITKQCIENILEQMNNTIYLINEQNENFESGIFCKIKYNEINIPIVIINRYLSDEEINISINVSRKNGFQNISLGEVKYRNKDYNITMIEIKENYNENINFIELDNNLNKNDSEIYYDEKQIYIIQLNNKKDISVSYGIIKNIKDSNILYSSKLNENLKFSLICDLSNNKLLGINVSKSKYFNNGIFFKFMIEKFINKYKYINILKNKKKYKNSSQKNEIKLSIKVYLEDINQKIYFLNKDIKKLNINNLNTEL